MTIIGGLVKNHAKVHDDNISFIFTIMIRGYALKGLYQLCLTWVVFKKQMFLWTYSDDMFLIIYIAMIAWYILRFHNKCKLNSPGIGFQAIIFLSLLMFSFS